MNSNLNTCNGWHDSRSYISVSVDGPVMCDICRREVVRPIPIPNKPPTLRPPPPRPAPPNVLVNEAT